MTDLAGLIERLRRVSDRRSLTIGAIWTIAGEAADEITRLQAELAEAQDPDRLIMVLAEVREASGVGHKPMLGDVPEAIRDKISGMEAELSRLRSEVERATGHVRNLVNERGCPSCGGAPTNAKRAARDFLNGLGGEG